MYKDKRIIALIPARGGSVGVKRKNVREFCGKPLIYWTIEACKKSKYIDEFYVSTEDEEIKNVSLSFGAKVLDRPKSLAENNSHIKDVMKYHIEELGLGNNDLLVLLNPTSPIRISNGINIIDYCIEQFDYENKDQAASVYMCQHYPYGTSASANRQELSAYPYDNGSVYINKVEHLKDGIYWVDNPDRRQAIVVPEIFNYEIDTEIDFIMVESLMKYLQFKEYENVQF